ncbi:MAG: response regulator transcription factor [Bacillota bacterium]|nr:response regulator transcription factor [Bacillota bacterium]
MDRIRVLIVDDQTLMRDGLKTILDYQEDIEVVGTAANGAEALKLVDAAEVDVVLMDVRMEGMNGIECTRLLKEKYPDIVVLILTTFNDEEYIRESLKNKASGYILKDIEGTKLVEAIKYAFKGNVIMPVSVADKLSSSLGNGDRKIRASFEGEIHFSRLERDIIKLLIEGYTNKQIASVLHISYGTVKNYVSQIYEKIGASERVKAVTILKGMMEG